MRLKKEISSLNRSLIENSNALFFNILLVTLLLTILATIIGYIALKALFINPIEAINRQLEHMPSDNTLLECKDKGEIGVLVENLNRRTVNLAKSRAKVAKEHELRLANEEMLMQQSKMAMMGEMMDSVAHQWKQPLNALTLYSELIRNDFEDGVVDKEYIEEYRKNLQVQIDHMVNTLDEFRSFFRPNKEKETFKLIDVVNSALFLAKDDILKHRILVKIAREDSIEIHGFPNELKHLILNIINNAKDAFIEHNIEKRLITIELISDKEGGETGDMRQCRRYSRRCYRPYLRSQRDDKRGGQGHRHRAAYEPEDPHKHDATIEAENRDEGACFIITFRKAKQPHSPQDDR